MVIQAKAIIWWLWGCLLCIWLRRWVAQFLKAHAVWVASDCDTNWKDSIHFQKCATSRMVVQANQGPWSWAMSGWGCGFVFTKSLQLEIVEVNKTPEQSAASCYQPFVFPQTVYCWGSHCFLSGLSLACRLVSHVVSHLVWDAASAFKACLPSCLRWSGMLCRALRLSPKFHVRFVQLFRVYCGVISILSLWHALFSTLRNADRAQNLGQVFSVYLGKPCRPSQKLTRQMKD